MSELNFDKPINKNTPRSSIDSVDSKTSSTHEGIDALSAKQIIKNTKELLSIAESINDQKNNQSVKLPTPEQIKQNSNEGIIQLQQNSNIATHSLSRLKKVNWRKIAKYAAVTGGFAATAYISLPAILSIAGYTGLTTGTAVAGTSGSIGTFGSIGLAKATIDGAGAFMGVGATAISSGLGYLGYKFTKMISKLQTEENKKQPKINSKNIFQAKSRKPNNYRYSYTPKKQHQPSNPIQSTNQKTLSKNPRYMFNSLNPFTKKNQTSKPEELLNSEKKNNIQKLAEVSKIVESLNLEIQISDKLKKQSSDILKNDSRNFIYRMDNEFIPSIMQQHSVIKVEAVKTEVEAGNSQFTSALEKLNNTTEPISYQNTKPESPKPVKKVTTRSTKSSSQSQSNQTKTVENPVSTVSGGKPTATDRKPSQNQQPQELNTIKESGINEGDLNNNQKQPYLEKISNISQAEKQATREILCKNYSFEIFRPSKIDGKYGIYGEDPAGREISNELQTAEKIAIGDLHGSFVKLIETLVAGGMAHIESGKAEKLIELSQICRDIFYNFALAADTRKNIRSDWKHYKLNRATLVFSNQPNFSWVTNSEGSFSYHPQLDLAKSIIDPKTGQKDLPFLMGIKQYKLAYTELKEIMSEVVWIGGDRKLLMLGDVLGDRGVSDYLTMTLIESLRNQAKLAGNNNPIEIIASNHDLGIIGVDPNIGQYSAPNNSYGTSFLLESIDDIENKYSEYFYQLKMFHYDTNTDSFFAHSRISSDIRNNPDTKSINNCANIGYLKILTGFDPNIEIANPSEFVAKSNKVLSDLITRYYNPNKHKISEVSIENHWKSLVDYSKKTKQKFSLQSKTIDEKFSHAYNIYQQKGMGEIEARNKAKIYILYSILNNIVSQRSNSDQKTILRSKNYIHGHDENNYQKYKPKDLNIQTPFCLDNGINKYIEGEKKFKDRKSPLYIY